MTAQNKHTGDYTGDYNENWESQIAEYHDECKKREMEFLKTHMVVPDSGIDSLDDAENEVLRLVLQGLSCQEIAQETKTDSEMVFGLLEIIRAKLSLEK